MNKFVKIGLIGYGRHMDHSMFPNIISNEATEVVSVADISAERIELIKHKIPGIKTYDSGDALVTAAADDGLDAVVISLTPQGHLKYAELALQAGLNVFVEKPVAINSIDLDPLIDIAEKHKLVTCVGTKWRYTKATKLAQKLCFSQKKYLPRVITLEATFPHGLFKDNMWNLSNKTEMTYYDMFVHAFDYIESWIPGGNLINTKKIYDNGNTEVVSAEISNKETTALLTLIRGTQQYGMQFESVLENGAKLSMKNLTEISLIDDNSWIGTEGSLRDQPTMKWQQGRLYRGYARAGYREEWDSFISAIQNGGDTPTNLKTAKLAIQKIESSLSVLSK